MDWGRIRAGACFALAIFLSSGVSPEAAPRPQAAITHYADLAQAVYGDALTGAKTLSADIAAFLSRPSPETLRAAREAWKTARIPYLQSEGFRFANGVVDAVEPRINAWPLDEGLIDYVAPSYGTQSDENPLYTLNVIARPHIRVGAAMVDATRIDRTLLRRLQQAEGVQTNVSTGYHAIEFLLWGENLHGAGAHSGERTASDYDTVHCAHDNCARRADYLRAAAELLVEDLGELEKDWAPGGAARAELLAKGPDGGLSEILTGLGSLSFGEMAGERMKVGLMLHDPKEAQDCFSNNTHNSHYYDEEGIIGIWNGRYTDSAGHITSGSSVRDYAMAVDPRSAQTLDRALSDTLATLKVMKDAADSGRMPYDRMLVAGNAEGNRIVSDAMDALVVQTHAIEAVATSLHLKIASNKSDHGPSGLN